MEDKLPEGLLRRIEALEKPENQGEGFAPIDWFWLALLGAIGPALLLWWGWA